MSIIIPLLSGLALLSAEPPRDWAETLRTDARAFHDDIAANHPGMVNALDPDFARREAAAYDLLLKRARSVRDYAGYRFALAGYAASFDDGHLAVALPPDAPTLASRWPGFLTGFDAGGAQVVMTRADDAPVPLGARLVSCDGRAADALARENVGAFEGRWFLASRRSFRGGRLFVDQGNPFVKRPANCTFDVAGARRSVSLGWKTIDEAALRSRLSDTTQRAAEPIGAMRLEDGTRWYTLSGFNGDPQSADAMALTPLIAGMRADRAALGGAPRIVLDLRGNNGGSSNWSYEIAQILWGEAAVAALPDETYVEWRASPAVLETIESYRARFEAAPGTSARMKAFFRSAAEGLRSAVGRGDTLWREPSETGQKPATATARPALPPVYFITDTGCGSACLDAVDVWRALGAIHVGQETSADTLYMDVRSAMLPSGLSRAIIPMKVYRGRPRGSNEPVKPHYAYPGDLRETSALTTWLQALPPSRP